MDDLEHDIAVIQQWASSTPIVHRVWIFGSRVRGTNSPESDLDVTVEHGALPGDSDVYTTGLCEPENWRAQLQPLVRLRLDAQSYVPGDTVVVEAGLHKSSQLIYERA